MITEDYVNLETAKLLKEKGFNIACFDFYEMEYGMFVKKHTQRSRPVDWNGEEDDGCCSAPTLQMAMKWLRELYHFHITVFSQSQESWMYRITIPGQMLKDGDYGEDFTTYEDAAAAAVEYCLEHKIIM